MKAKELLEFLLELEKQGNDLNNIDIMYRDNFDSNVTQVYFVDEDLYDQETNSKLLSIVLINDNSDIY